MSDEPDLPPELRDLEAKLRKARPAPLREEFCDRLKAAPSSGRSRLLPWLAAAAVLLGAVTMFLWVTHANPRPGELANRHAHPEDVGPDTPPTWLAYTRALNESPEELDRLLVAHDRQLLQPAPKLERNFTF
jgi:hypothetical protein